MAKNQDIDDLLGAGKPATKTQAPAKKATATDKVEKAPAKPAKAEKAPAKTEKAAKEPRVREPVEFAEGEKEALSKRIPKLLTKGGINSKELAVKLDIKTRKLRPVLYALERAKAIKLTPAASRTQGMLVEAV